MTKNIAISVNNLYKSYGETEVLKGLSFDVPKGTMLALLGPNGAGKTTTVRILSTLLSFDTGQVSVNGFDVDTQQAQVRQHIGLTGQSASVDEMLTGRENLIMMGQLYRLTRASARSRADELLTQFDLVDAANRTLKTYSGGMRRRLDLAVSLIAAPPVIFLDEPTTGLDPRSRMAMWQTIRQLKKDGATILLTTQYLEEADQLADRIILIDNGIIAAEGTATSLKKMIGNDRLELTFATTIAYSKAQKTLGDIVVAQTPGEKMLSVLIEDVNKDVANTLALLTAAKIKIDTIAIHKPTLDDVFLTVTEKERVS
ncbi:MAG: ATP-binding cassette domain-containing protein [Candidatus Saccharimonadales bacterium]